ncbi:MAG: AsmA-like C-terminal region-containing protein [Hyphomicrobiaceae bacterium]
MEPAPFERDEAPTRGRRALRHARRSFNLVLIAVVPLIVLAVFGLALGYVKLQHGPISLGMLVGPIERSINAELEGHRVDIADAVVMLTPEHRLEFRLKDVSFIDASGNPVASAPLAAIEMSDAALFKGRLAPSRVELIDPVVFATYRKATGFSLSFSAAPLAADRVSGDRPAAQAPLHPVTPHGQTDAPMRLQRLDLGKLIAQTSQETHAGADAATSFLRELGLRNATLNVDNEGRRSRWQVPELILDLERRKRRTIISGRARLAAPRGSWAVAFHTEENEGLVSLNTSIRDVVPADLAEAGEMFQAWAPLDLPIAADIRVGLTHQGEIVSSEVAVELGSGRVLVTDRHGHVSAVPVEAGLVKLAYDPATSAVVLAPSTVKWSGNTVTLTGAAKPQAADGIWDFEVHSLDGSISAGEFAVARIPVEDWRATGRIMTREQHVEIAAASLKVGGTDLTASGEVSYRLGQAGVRLDIGANGIPIETFKAVWLEGIAPKSRQWVGTHVDAARIESFQLRLESGSLLSGEAANVPGRPPHAAITVVARDASFRPLATLPAVAAPNVLVRLDGDVLDVTMDAARMQLASGQGIDLKSIRLLSNDVHNEPATGELSFKSQSDVQPVIEVLTAGNSPLLRAVDLKGKRVTGRVEADLAIVFPMIPQPDATRVRMTGKARLTDGKAQDIIGDLDLQGATVSFDFNSGAIDARGEALAKGVPIKIAWQRIFEASPDRQPPLRITATLDNADRVQLGLDVNHLIRGEVPIDIQVVALPDRAAPDIHVRADLSNAEIDLSAVSWTKPPGRAAFAEFDVVAAEGRHELRNVRIAGDSIAIGGGALIGPDRRLVSFDFPEFTLNVVSRLKVSGTAGSDGVWKIAARGPTFDGRDFFRSLFAPGRDAPAPVSSKRRSGIDLEAEIDTVLGFSEVSMRGLKLSLARRDGQLTALDASGKLDGGAAIAVLLDHDKAGARRIRADSTDAGQAFKLTGFYPNMQSGRVRLEVNVDGSGAAEKTGTLWVDDFRVLGDAVLSEVVSSVDEGRPSISGKSSRRVMREVFNFDALRVPFSVGHGQFVMYDAYVRGPLLGASIRGKVDYKTERVSFGGTYIPLQGLNNLFGQIPVVGQILSGPRGEGIFGITFAVQGAMADPQVIVNPLSLVAPGIFREVFQMTNPDPQVLPRAKARRPGQDDEVGGSTVPGTTIDGWSSHTKR